MSGTAVNGSGSALTMEPEGEVMPAEEVSDLTAIFVGGEEDEDDESTMTVNAEGGEPFDASEMTPEQIAAGLQNLSGGVATSQDIENAARAEDGLPPLEAAGLLDFGPFNPDNALKAIFEKSAEVRQLQSLYDRAKDAAKEAKSELDVAAKALVNIIESLKNRRTQALNPSQPYLKDVSGDNAVSTSKCPWEREHPGQSCPICTQAQSIDLAPALESEVHPEHEGHAAVAEAARVKTVLEPLAIELVKVNVYASIDDLAALSTEDLTALQLYVEEPSPIPPQILAKTCRAAERGSIIQVCQVCERVLLDITAGVDPYPVDARVGFQCANAPAPVIEPAKTDEAPRRPRSHARKSAARKTEPEKERVQQAEAGRKAAAKKPQRRHNDTGKGKKAAKKGKR